MEPKNEGFGGGVIPGWEMQAALSEAQDADQLVAEMDHAIAEAVLRAIKANRDDYANKLRTAIGL